MTPIQEELYPHLKNYSVKQLLELNLIDEARCVEIVIAEEMGGILNENPLERGSDFIIEQDSPNAKIFGGYNEVKTSSTTKWFDGSERSRFTLKNLSSKGKSHLQVWGQDLDTNSLVKYSFPRKVWTKNWSGGSIFLSSKSLLDLIRSLPYTKKMISSKDLNFSWADQYIHTIKVAGKVIYSK